jgi:hypothetical protein
MMAKNPGKSALLTTAAATLVNISGDKNDSWLTKLEKLINNVWDIGKFIKDNGKILAVAGTVAYGLF